MGEPLNHEAWHWFHDLVGEGRCDLVDSWWQTETGGIAIAPRPSAQGTIINLKKNFDFTFKFQMKVFMTYFHKFTNFQNNNRK